MREYSIYEAKAKLSELIRFVKAHGRVTITERGRPVVQLIPLDEGLETLEDRVHELMNSGQMSRATEDKKTQGRVKPLWKSKGALKRFLESRD